MSSRSAAAAVEFIQQQADLSDRAKLGFRYLVHNSPSYEQDVKDADVEFKTDWLHSWKLLNIHACKQDDGKVYRVRGVTRFACGREVGGCWSPLARRRPGRLGCLPLLPAALFSP